eukprot:3432468-Prymnesium_polylepis.1
MLLDVTSLRTLCRANYSGTLHEVLDHLELAAGSGARRAPHFVRGVRRRRWHAYLVLTKPSTIVELQPRATKYPYLAHLEDGTEFVFGLPDDRVCICWPSRSRIVDAGGACLPVRRGGRSPPSLDNDCI